MSDAEILFPEREYELKKVQFRFAKIVSIALGIAFVVALFPTYYVFGEISENNKKNAYLVGQELDNVRENTEELVFRLKQQEEDLTTLRASITDLEATMLERLKGYDRQFHALKLAEKGLSGEKLTATEEKFVESEAEKSKDDETAESLYLRGYTEYAQGNYDSAVTFFTDAIKIDPNSRDAYQARGESYAELGKHEEAIKDYTKVIEIGPVTALIYHERGSSLNFLGNFKQAISDYGRAIEIEPSNHDGYHNRGLSYFQLGEDGRAEADMLEAFNLSVGSHRANSLENIGLIRIRYKRWQEAFDNSDVVNNIDERMTWNSLIRAIAADKLGKKEEFNKAHSKWRELKTEQDIEYLKKLLSVDLHYYLKYLPNDARAE